MAASRKGDDNGDGLVIIYNVMANRSIPIVFILVSSLIIANISCDQVGSANALAPIRAASDKFESSSSPTTSSGGGTGNGSATKSDPLNLLREIYLDQNSKVITLLSSPDSNSVQKFHPNGRYGRRSVDNFADEPGAHMELATLRFDGEGSEDGASRPRSDLDANQTPWSTESGKQQIQRQQLRKWLLANYQKLANNPMRKQQTASNKKSDSPIESSLAIHRQELNKLLKCNYSGVSNLFWCES